MVEINIDIKTMNLQYEKDNKKHFKNPKIRMEREG
jgi:hypothetical protein